MNKDFFIKGFTLAFFSLGIISCISQDEPFSSEIVNGKDEAKTCPVIFNIKRQGFEDEQNTRSASTWENGDIVYLVFNTASGTTYGDAIYNNGEWALTYYGTLVSEASTPCKAYYIENPDSETGSIINLSSQSCIYESTNAMYLYEGGSLTVTAVLSPKIGRIRFQGKDGDQIKVFGLSHYSSFNTTTGTFKDTPSLLNLTVSNGYTPYVYGKFSQENEPRLAIFNAEYGYTKQFSTNIYQAGQSGYVTIPTPSSHSGWRNNIILNINGVDFTMIPVKYDKGDFLLAETETTQELFYTITGKGTSSQKPQNGENTNNYWDSFIRELKNLTGFNFRLPTSEEWMYAAKGGIKSQGFTYSGSNDIYEVAWFQDNSDGHTHDVKQLAPNELGFYDMSGNVGECVSDNKNYYGGYYSRAASGCTVTSYSNTSMSAIYSAQLGLRLAVSND